MENKDNQELRTAFWLLGPLLFYELCTEAAGLACSLFGTQDAMAVTGGGALLALPFLYAAYRKKLQVDVRERDAGAEHGYETDAVSQAFAGRLLFRSCGWQWCLSLSECAP